MKQSDVASYHDAKNMLIKYINMSRLLIKDNEQEDFILSLKKVLDFINQISNINAKDYPFFQRDWIKIRFRSDEINEKTMNALERVNTSRKIHNFVEVPVVIGDKS